MFNGIREREGFDNNGGYIKSYIGRLNEVDGKYLDDSDKLEEEIKGEGVEIGKEYGKEMIDEKESREGVM
ncbi:FAD-binding domain-containing protein [Staphylococcus epidermidis]|uniref:FAD-binding domain-containing protein n=1 Tax=Staphylococcus epidermidis TaxID=1282 RepID=UPI0021B29A19|nr:FAD-binding domain-containing protein [Staphylococcus epidermidis]